MNGTAAPSALFARRTAWTVIGLAAAVLVMDVLVRPVPWPLWAMPLLLAAHAGVTASGVTRSRPRLARTLLQIVLGLALVMAVAEAVSLFRR
jgi:hypothetical protein